jgi:phosphate transport system substrate-binding protein
MLRSNSVTTFRMMLAFLFFGIAGVGTAYAEEVKIGGVATAIDALFKKRQAAIEQATGEKLVFVPSNPVQAFKDLDAGAIQGAVSGLPFADWLALVEKEGKLVPNKMLYKPVIIGRTVIRVFTNQDVTLPALTPEQLTAVFSGKAANWSDIGGPNLPVVVVAGSELRGIQTFVQKTVMANTPFLASPVEVSTAGELKNKVTSTPGAVALGPQSLVDDTVHAPTVPEMSLPVTFLVKRDASPSLLKVVDFIRSNK